MVIGLCDRWHIAPSQVLAEDVTILQMLAVYDLAHPQEVTSG